MIKLTKEKDRVTGIIAKGAEENYIQIKASKGVIVCTGGYSLNYDMLQALQPENVAMVGRNGSIPGASGDGIKACIWAGGKFDETHSMMMFDRAALKVDAKPGIDQLKKGESRIFLDGLSAVFKGQSRRRTVFQ